MSHLLLLRERQNNNRRNQSCCSMLGMRNPFRLILYSKMLRLDEVHFPYHTWSI